MIGLRENTTAELAKTKNVRLSSDPFPGSGDETKLAIVIIAASAKICTIDRSRSRLLICRLSVR